MPYPYNPPEFLTDQTADVIHRRMLEAMPGDIDKSELQIPWDFTRPAALEKAEFVQFELNETIKTIFPHWATGIWLDKHADTVGLKRWEANRAAGYVLVTGKAGMTVKKGFQFATVSNLTPSVLFEAAETVDFPTQDPDPHGCVTVYIAIRAMEGGPVGNVAPDTIKLMMKPDTNITYVFNPEAITGGTVEENDDDLRERVLAVLRGGISFTGCDADYIRWAKQVNAVGSVVVDPEWDDPSLPEQFHWTDGRGYRHCAGAVRIFIVDANGVPANWQILNAVYEHIVSPNDRLKRLAPIGATVTVAAPAPLIIDITARVILKPGEVLAAVLERFKANLNKYWLTSVMDTGKESMYVTNCVKYVYIGATLAETAGIYDYDHSTLLVNGDMENIDILIGMFPVTGTVTLYV